MEIVSEGCEITMKTGCEWIFLVLVDSRCLGKKIVVVVQVI